MAGGKTILETERLRLREMSEADLDFLSALLGDAAVMRYWPKTCDREESRAWIKRQEERYARDGFGFWLAVSKATGLPVGQAGLFLGVARKLKLKVEGETIYYDLRHLIFAAHPSLLS